MVKEGRILILFILFRIYIQIQLLDICETNNWQRNNAAFLFCLALQQSPPPPPPCLTQWRKWGLIGPPVLFDFYASRWILHLQHISWLKRSRVTFPALFLRHKTCQLEEDSTGTRCCYIIIIIITCTVAIKVAFLNLVHPLGARRSIFIWKWCVQ
jgi:hypothetical protein